MGAPAQSPPAQPVRIRITDGTTVLTAWLHATPSAAAFAAMLPLNLPIADHAGQEKIADLPRKLRTTGAPEGADPAAGDIAYYAPWGNLALYYRDAPYASGLVLLGRLEGGSAQLAAWRAPRVTIERIHLGKTHANPRPAVP